MKTCKSENCEKSVWSKGFCGYHFKKEKLSPPKEKMLEIQQRNKALNLFFKKMWASRKHKSEISNVSLGNKFSTLYMHHILPKSKYPEAALDPDNIIFLTGDEHATVEMNSTKYEEINKRRELLKIKYNIL